MTSAALFVAVSADRKAERLRKRLAGEPEGFFDRYWPEVLGVALGMAFLLGWDGLLGRL